MTGDPLAPVRAALLSSATAYAHDVAAASDAAAGLLARDTRAQAEQLVATAREQGASDAASVLAARRARGREQVRALVLHARRAAYDDLRQAARTRARLLMAGRTGLERSLGAVAHDRLGPGARLSARPDGTVLAELEGRALVWSPDALADDALGALGPEIERLWAP